MNTHHTFTVQIRNKKTRKTKFFILVQTRKITNLPWIDVYGLPTFTNMYRHTIHIHFLYPQTWAKMSLYFSLLYRKINCCVTITPIKFEIIVTFCLVGYLPCPRANEGGMSPLKQVVFLTIKWIKWFNLFDNRCSTQ